MNAPMPLPELKARQQVVWRALAAANDVRFSLSQRSPSFMEWQLIAEACSREAQRLHRIWRRWYAPKGWTA